MRKQTGNRSEKRARQVRVYKQYAAIAAALFAALILIYCLIARSYRTRFLRNTTINGFEVGKLTAEETETILKESVEKYKLTLQFQDGKKETLSGSDLGLTYISSGEVQTLLDSQKRMSWLSHLFGKTSSYEVETSYEFDSSEVEAAISALPEFQEDQIVHPQDAYIELKDLEEFVIVPEENGNELNSSVVFEEAETAIRHGVKTLDLTETDDAYLRPDVLSSDESLLEQLDDLNSYISTTVTMILDDGQKSRVRETVSKNTLISWLSTDEDGSYVIDSAVVADRCWTLVQALADRYNHTESTMEFASTRLGTKTVSCDPYGYKLDVDTVAEQLCNDVIAARSEEFEIENSVQTEADPTFGGTYIEVDVTNQHVWFYQNGSLFFETDCVTGLESDPERLTPSGVFAIYGKDENKTLEGRLTADGPVTYSSDVDCWMPFYESYGMHDAPWRDTFGGDIYLTNGSHGCVNLPVEAAHTIFDNAPVGTTVIVLRESD